MDNKLQETDQILEEVFADSSDDVFGGLRSMMEQSLRSFARNHDLERTFVDLLPPLLQCTSSGFGFIAEVRYTSPERPYLHSHAVTDIYKSGFRRTDVISNLQFHNLNTLNGAILTERAPIVTNEPDSDHRSGGVPMGHVKLSGYCGLPFLIRGELVGALAIANRPGGYTQTHVQALQPFCEIAGRMIVNTRRRNDA
ncbi:MAG: GAF domain-containing protein [Candidatus Latescibacteria bacterium]|nr:GAF domain-containing protein [Candidatus Latescibacterota bacterium]